MDGPGSANDPGESNEEDDAEDVLYAGEVNADERAHASTAAGGRSGGGGFAVRVRRRWYRRAVVRQTAEQCWHARSLFQFFLERVIYATI